MSNPQDPVNINIKPGSAVAGATVDDFTLKYAKAPNNVVPVGFPTGAPTVVVPKSDLTALQPDGTYKVPFPDVALSTLAPGTYVLDAVATSTQAGTTSIESNRVFFDVSQPNPNPPVLSVA